MSKSNDDPFELFDDASKYISEFCIEDTMRSALCFKETLVINLKDKFIRVYPVGNYNISVESVGPRKDEFLIRTDSFIKNNDESSQAKMLGLITYKFQCLEEKRTEEDDTCKRTLYLAVKDNSYYVKVGRSCPCDESTKIKCFPFNTTRISETANFLFMRYLAVVDYQGVHRCQRITMDGKIVACRYTFTPAKSIILDDSCVKAYKVECKMYDEDEFLYKTETFLTEDGKILRHDCSGAPYALMNVSVLNEETIKKENYIGVSLRESWMENIEYLSKYLDEQFYQTEGFTAYLTEHPEIRNLISNYMQILLVVKPVNVLDFTMQHFKSFDKHIDVIKSSSEETSSSGVSVELTENKSGESCDL